MFVNILYLSRTPVNEKNNKPRSAGNSIQVKRAFIVMFENVAIFNQLHNECAPKGRVINSLTKKPKLSNLINALFDVINLVVGLALDDFLYDDLLVQQELLRVENDDALWRHAAQIFFPDAGERGQGRLDFGK